MTLRIPLLELEATALRGPSQVFVSTATHGAGSGPRRWLLEEATDDTRVHFVRAGSLNVSSAEPCSVYAAVTGAGSRAARVLSTAVEIDSDLQHLRPQSFDIVSNKLNCSRRHISHVKLRSTEDGP